MISRLRTWFKNVFGFSQTEINGFIILTGLLVIAIIIPFFFGESQGYSNVASDRSILDSVVQNFKHQSQSNRADYQTSASKENTTESSEAESTPAVQIHYHPFDPNHTTVNSWLSLGVSEKIANRIDHYLDKGGKFYHKKDLLKIYGFKNGVYQKLEPYITLPEEQKKKQDKAYDSSSNTEFESKQPFVTANKASAITPFEINSCNAEDLKQIRGIGEKLSERIIKFRDALGGFYIKDQYQDIYGLDSTVLEALNEYSSIDTLLLKKININTVSNDELSKHVYINYKLSNILINYRSQHGPFKDLNELKNIYYLKNKEDLYQKIIPYLTIQ